MGLASGTGIEVPAKGLLATKSTSVDWDPTAAGQFRVA
jgi:hypothetical protein